MIKFLNQLIYSILTLLIPVFTFAQVVTVSPSFPTENDEVTIVFDATQGSLFVEN